MCSDLAVLQSCCASAPSVDRPAAPPPGPASGRVPHHDPACSRERRVHPTPLGPLPFIVLPWARPDLLAAAAPCDTSRVTPAAQARGTRLGTGWSVAGGHRGWAPHIAPLLAPQHRPAGMHVTSALHRGRTVLRVCQQQHWAGIQVRELLAAPSNRAPAGAAAGGSQQAKRTVTQPAHSLPALRSRSQAPCEARAGPACCRAGQWRPCCCRSPAARGRDPSPCSDARCRRRVSRRSAPRAPPTRGRRRRACRRAARQAPLRWAAGE